MAQTITLSSGGTATMIVNPVAKSTTVMYTVTATSSGVSQVEMSLDDPTILNGPTATWALLSTTTAMQSSNAPAGGLVYTILSPVAGIRLTSTSSFNGAATVKVLQSITA